MESVLSVGPVVKRETRTLWQRTEVGGERRSVEFTQTLLWVRESAARVSLWHREAKITGLNSFNDWYGFLSAPEQALREIGRYRHTYQVRPGDVLRVVISMDLVDRPLVEDRSTYGVEWNARAERKRYLQPPRDWHTAPAYSEVSGWPNLAPAVLIDDEVIYSTAEPDESRLYERVARLKAEASDARGV